MNQGTKIALGILGAAIAGAIVYTLVAPEKANAIKRKFADGADDLANKMADYFTEAKEHLKAGKATV